MATWVLISFPWQSSRCTPSSRRWERKLFLWWMHLISQMGCWTRCWVAMMVMCTPTYMSGHRRLPGTGNRYDRHCSFGWIIRWITIWLSTLSIVGMNNHMNTCMNNHLTIRVLSINNHMNNHMDNYLTLHRFMMYIQSTSSHCWNQKPNFKDGCLFSSFWLYSCVTTPQRCFLFKW